MTLRDALRMWLKIGLLSFGGPAGQIALMHKELVEDRKIVGERRYLHALQYCMLLPGPEAQQLATYVGWLLHGVKGGVAAGALFVIPGALVMLALSAAYVQLHDVTLITGLLFGLKAAVLAVVAAALIRIGRRALSSPFAVGVAAAAFVALTFFAAPFPAVVAGAAVVGLVAVRRSSGASTAADAAAGSGDDDAGTIVGAMAARGELQHTTASVARSLTTSMVCAALWAAPVVAAVALLGRAHVVADEGVFFSKAAAVTFGGAYAVLAWVGQRAVALSWLEPREVIDGLALGETTPGPLILVLEFVAFIAAARTWPSSSSSDSIHPLLAGSIGAAMMLWTTFVPSITWILVGAPWVEKLRGNKNLDAALAAITAAVVGVIAQLSLWLALHALFHDVRDVQLAGGYVHLPVPDVGTVDVAMAALTALAFALLFAAKLGMARTLLIVGALGAVVTALGPR